MSTTDDKTQLRKRIYVLLITVVVGMATGRILGVERVYEPTLYKANKDDTTRRGSWPSKRPPAMPTFSSNDRSRWAMIRCLVDHGTFVIGERDRKLLEPSAASLLAATNPLDATTLAIAGREMRIASTHSTWQTEEEGWDPGWDTVDKALNPATQKFYSTKPPLVPIMVAGLYWLLEHATGWTLAENVWEVVKTLVFFINVVPFAIYLWLLALLVERFGKTDWSKLYIFAAGCFATLVTPFLITFNNHTIGTFSAMFALYPGLLILTWGRLPSENAAQSQAGSAPRYLFILAGLFAGFTVCNELPALAFAVGLGLILLLRAPRRTLIYFLPAAIVPLTALVITNYIATGMVRPIYALRYTNWYKYEGSHWSYPPGTHRGIDYAKYHEERSDYFFHMLLGHHGLFSLTPIWIFAFAGMLIGMFLRRRKTQQEDKSILPASRETGTETNTSSDGMPASGMETPPRRQLPWYFFAASLLLSLIILGFYLTNRERNYGGWTAGLRWLMWLAPMWLLSMLPVIDWLAKYRWGRGLAYLLLALSVLSASFPAWNPWRHPWIYRWMDANGWLPY